MKDREVMIVFNPCQLSPEERILAKELYDRAERAERIPIGNQMLFAKYVMTEGTILFLLNETNFSNKNLLHPYVPWKSIWRKPGE